MKKAIITLVIVVCSVSYGSPTNLALLGTASQSTTANDKYAYLAIDNNTDGDYYHGSVTHTWGLPDSWWQVDLGSSNSINQIDIWNRTDAGVSSRLHHFTLSILDSTYTEVWSVYVDGPAGIHETYGSLDSTPLGTGQYIKIQFDDDYTSDRYLHIAEVQVWNCGTPTVPLPSSILLLSSCLLGLHRTRRAIV